jgi:hypothetical protein
MFITAPLDGSLLISILVYKMNAHNKSTANTYVHLPASLSGALPGNEIIDA